MSGRLVRDRSVLGVAVGLLLHCTAACQGPSGAGLSDAAVAGDLASPRVEAEADVAAPSGQLDADAADAAIADGGSQLKPDATGPDSASLPDVKPPKSSPDSFITDIVNCPLGVTLSVALGAELPAAPTVVVQGHHRVILAAKTLPLTGCLTTDCNSAPCPAGQHPWRGVVAAPPVEHIALAADGAVMYAGGQSVGRMAVGGKGQFATAKQVMEPITLKGDVPSCSYLKSTGYQGLPELDSHAFADSSGSGFIWARRTGTNDPYNSPSEEIETSLHVRLRVSPTLGTTVLLTSIEEFAGAFHPKKHLWSRKVYDARSLPEGGVLVVETRRSFTADGDCEFQSLVMSETGIEKGATLAGSCTLFWQPTAPVAPADRLGTWWVMLRPVQYLGGWPQVLPAGQVLLVQGPATASKWSVACMGAMSHLALTTDGGVAVLGVPLAAPPASTALEVVRLALATGVETWRTTLVLPMAVQPLAVERLPNGGLLLAAVRSQGGHALWLAWLDATGALVRERLLALPATASAPPLVAVGVDGGIALAIDHGGSRRIATLDAKGDSGCKQEVAPCSVCDDGNPCTQDVCTKFGCWHGPASGLSCSGSCVKGQCFQCTDCVDKPYGDICFDKFTLQQEKTCIEAAYCAIKYTYLPKSKP